MYKLRFKNLIQFKQKKEDKLLIASPQRQQFDLVLLGIVLFLSFFGLLMVYNVSQVEAYQTVGDKLYFFRQQLIWFVLGFSGLAFFSFFNHNFLKKIALPFFVISLILLLLVFIPGLGVSAGGAHRWLRVAGFTIQPAEIIKLATILLFAAVFSRKLTTSFFVIVMGLVVAVIGILQKDLGSAIVFSLIGAGMYFAAGAPTIYLILCSVGGIISFIGFILTSEYRKNRVLAFLDPFADPQGYTYHISQVLVALGSGGFFGLGIGQSRQKFAYIPEVTTDSIFSIMGEEMGLVGGMIVILLFALVILRGIKIATEAHDSFAKFLSIGLTLWLGSQAVINLAAMVALIPLTGVPLPFISYGGSALMANLVAVGILLNISRQVKG